MCVLVCVRVDLAVCLFRVCVCERERERERERKREREKEKEREREREKERERERERGGERERVCVWERVRVCADVCVGTVAREIQATIMWHGWPASTSWACPAHQFSVYI